MRVVEWFRKSREPEVPKFRPVRWRCAQCGTTAPGRGTCEAERLWLPDGWGTFMVESNRLCPDCYDEAEPPEFVLEFRAALGFTDTPPQRTRGRLYLDAKARGERYVYATPEPRPVDPSAAFVGLADQITDQIERKGR